MLNPPLSLLSDDVLAFIVDHTATLPTADETLKNLSLADRAFTHSCQKYIFRRLILWNSTDISKILTNLKRILDDKPSYANLVRMVELLILRDESAWLFQDNSTFITILQLLAKSPVPPHELQLGGETLASPLILKDPIFVVRQLARSFFSHTLTILHVRCAHVPLPLVLICPRLRELILDQVVTTDKSYDKYPDNQCSGLLRLEALDYRDAHALVEQMITPPPRFSSPVVIWSNLRILKLSPHEKEGMDCLQTILDAASDRLEELYLTNVQVSESRQLSLAGLMNLTNLSNLRVFALYAIIKCKAPRKAPRLAVLHDINVVLSTIPNSNKITNLWFDLEIIGRRPFRACLDEDWDGMFNEIIRISDGKPLELEAQMVATSGNLADENPGQDQLFEYIMGKGAGLSQYPNICTHFWNPTFWDRGLSPFPSGEVRSRCKR